MVLAFAICHCFAAIFFISIKLRGAAAGGGRVDPLDLRAGGKRYAHSGDRGLDDLGF